LSDPISVKLKTDVLTRLAPPEDFILYQNYPNPFNPTTTITFGIPQDESVRMDIFNMRGELARQLINKRLGAGTYILTWDGLDNSGLRLPSGIYFCRMVSGDFVSIKKLTLTK
jgi:flagellar hook assembly protein FlgD